MGYISKAKESKKAKKDKLKKEKAEKRKEEKWKADEVSNLEKRVNKRFRALCKEDKNFVYKTDRYPQYFKLTYKKVRILRLYFDWSHWDYYGPTEGASCHITTTLPAPDGKDNRQSHVFRRYISDEDIDAFIVKLVEAVI